MKVAAVAAFVSVLTNAEYTREHFMERARAPAPGPVPGPGPAPGPNYVEDSVSTKERFEEKVEDHFEEEIKELPPGPTPVILGWEVEFEIENYNYFDLNKPLEIVTEDPVEPAPKPKLAKPEAEKKDPGFWTRPAVDTGLGKTGKQMRNFPDKFQDVTRAGLYPVDLTDGSIGQHLTGSAETGVVEGKKTEKQELEKEVESAKQVEEKKPEAEAAKAEKPKGGGGVSSGVDKTLKQFNDMLSGNTPSHDTKGNFYPVNLALLQQQSKAHTAVGRCLTQEGVFADTCVVDVLRTAVKTSFVDLVETVLDTPEEREELLKWFVKDQAGKLKEDDADRAERIAKEAHEKAEKLQREAAEAAVKVEQLKKVNEEIAETNARKFGESMELAFRSFDAQMEAEQADSAAKEARQHAEAMKLEHQAAEEAAAGEFVQISKHGAAAVAEKLLARSAAPAPGPGPGPAPAVPVLEQSMNGKVDPIGAPAPGPAPLDGAVQTKAATGMVPAPGPAPGGSALQWKADVFVQFYPGEERPVVEDGDVGRSTIVKVWLRGEANTGIFELAPWIQAVLTRHEEDGLLQYLLEKRLSDATEIAPTIKGIKDIRLDSKSQWSIDTCATHMKKIMKEFSMAYTRRMVPTAIYNECTNFVSEVSFSHDRIFDSHDRMKCRHATVKLAKEWNFGKGHAPKSDTPGPAPAPGPAPGPGPVASVDYFGFCSDVCEIKYGSDAPMCHVTEGRKLWFAPP